MDPTQFDVNRLVATVILTLQKRPAEPTEFAWAWGEWRRHIVAIWALEPISTREASPDVPAPDKHKCRGDRVSHFILFLNVDE